MTDRLLITTSSAPVPGESRKRDDSSNTAGGGALG